MFIDLHFIGTFSNQLKPLPLHVYFINGRMQLVTSAALKFLNIFQNIFMNSRANIQNTAMCIIDACIFLELFLLCCNDFNSFIRVVYLLFWVANNNSVVSTVLVRSLPDFEFLIPFKSTENGEANERSERKKRGEKDNNKTSNINTRKSNSSCVCVCIWVRNGNPNGIPWKLAFRR